MPALLLPSGLCMVCCQTVPGVGLASCCQFLLILTGDVTCACHTCPQEEHGKEPLALWLLALSAALPHVSGVMGTSRATRSLLASLPGD